MSKQKKPVRGRPKVDDPRVNRVVVLYSGEEFAKINKAAKGYATLSDYVREKTLG
jgi:hypothetical protein